jgi:sensor histidine kinase YesM
MLIIPFVENAFKHGVAKSMEKSWINITIEETDHMLDIVFQIVKAKTLD